MSEPCKWDKVENEAAQTVQRVVALARRTAVGVGSAAKLIIIGGKPRVLVGIMCMLSKCGKAKNVAA